MAHIEADQVLEEIAHGDQFQVDRVVLAEQGDQLSVVRPLRSVQALDSPANVAELLAKEPNQGEHENIRGVDDLQKSQEKKEQMVTA